MLLNVSKAILEIGLEPLRPFNISFIPINSMPASNPPTSLNTFNCLSKSNPLSFASSAAPPPATSPIHAAGAPACITVAAFIALNIPPTP